MNSRSLLGLTCALIAHLAFLQAPNAHGAMMIAWYATGAAMLLVWASGFFKPLSQRTSSTSEQFIARLAESLVFIGYGYCTSEGPGVVKLFGVVPMGWTLTVVALLSEHLALLRGTSFSRMGGTHLRMVFLFVGLVLQAFFNPPWGRHTHDADQILGGLVAATFATIYLDMVRSSFQNSAKQSPR